MSQPKVWSPKTWSVLGSRVGAEGSSVSCTKYPLSGKRLRRRPQKDKSRSAQFIFCKIASCLCLKCHHNTMFWKKTHEISGKLSSNEAYKDSLTSAKKLYVVQPATFRVVTVCFPVVKWRQKLRCIVRPGVVISLINIEPPVFIRVTQDCFMAKSLTTSEHWPTGLVAQHSTDD